MKKKKKNDDARFLFKTFENSLPKLKKIKKYNFNPKWNDFELQQICEKHSSQEVVSDVHANIASNCDHVDHCEQDIWKREKRKESLYTIPIKDEYMMEMKIMQETKNEKKKKTNRNVKSVIVIS